MGIKRITTIRFIKSSLSLTCLGAFAYYIYLHKFEFLSAFQRIELATISIVGVTVLLQWFIRSYRDRIIYTTLGYRMAIGKIFSLNAIQLALNHLPLRAGTIFIAWRLKNGYGMSYTHFASAFAAQNLLMIMATCAIASVAFWIHPHTSSTTSGQLTLVLFLLLAGLSFCTFLVSPPPWIPLPAWVRSKFTQIQNGLHALKKNSRSFYGALVLSVIPFILTAIRLYFLYEATGIELTMTEAIILSSAAVLSLFISLTPAAIGIREGLVGLMSVILGMSSSAGIIAVSLERIIIIVLLSAILMWQALIHAVEALKHR